MPRGAELIDELIGENSLNLQANIPGAEAIDELIAPQPVPEPMQPAPPVQPIPAQRPRRGQAALEAFGRGAAFGGLPTLQAAAEPATTSILNILTGQQVPTGTFAQRRLENIARQRALREEAPALSGISTVAGAIPSAFLPQALIGRGFQGLRAVQGLGLPARLARLGGRLGTAGGAGAAAGFLEAPEEASEQISLQLAERLRGARRGIVGGLAFQAGGEALGTLGRAAIRQAPKFAVKAAGAFQSSINKILRKVDPKLARKRIDDLGNTILENKLVRAGDNIENIVGRTIVLRESVGKRIGDITRRTNEIVRNPQFRAGLNAGQLARLEQTALSPRKLAGEMEALIDQQFRGKAGYNQALSKARSIIEDFATIGDEADIADIQRFKTSLGNTIAYGTPTFQTDKQVAEGLRKFLRNKVRDRIAFLDDVLKTDDLAELKRADALFNKVSDLEEVVLGRLSSDLGNNLFSVRDVYLGGLGGMGGFGGFDGSMAERLGRAGLFGLTFGAISRGARRYGPPILSQTTERLRPLAGAAEAPIATGILGGRFAQ